MDKDIQQLDFALIDGIPNVDYTDGDIAFHKDIRELLNTRETEMGNKTLKMNLYITAACLRGKMQVNVNTCTFTIHQNEILIARPNDMISDCMLSPDFEGCILSLSQRIITECFSESDLWDKAFRIIENPIIHIGEEKLKMFYLYGELIQTKIKMEQTLFKKEIMISIARAAIYELLSNIGERTPYASGLMKQKDVLFKRFVELLASNRVKHHSLTWYANCLCITPKHLSNVCKQVSGKTAFGWINEYVEVDIRNMLKNSDKSIKEISEALNFPNMSFFGKYCRTHFGMSPTQYRKHLREEINANGG